MHKYFLLPIVSLLIIGAGCNSGQPKNSVEQNFNRPNNFNNASNTDRNIDQTKGGIADLIIGKKIMAMGTTNANGTINAGQITVGFENFNNQRFGPPSSTTSSTNGGQNGQFQRRNFNGGNGQNRTGDSGSGQRMANRSGQARALGEILKKDDISLILKLDNGGSQIVYYSTTTQIFIFQPPTPTTPQTPTATPSSN